MTPELKTACELVFQEHKLSAQPIKWSRDIFRGRITHGLSELAKETLVKKNIILWPDRSKKIFTTLNPDVATARSFEEAEKMIETKKPALTAMAVIEGDFNVADLAAEIDLPKTAVTASTPGHSTPTHNNTPTPSSPTTRSYSVMKIVPAIEPTEATILEVSGEKWWMKPLYLYFIWPICGAVVGVLISMLMNLAYHELFAHGR